MNKYIKIFILFVFLSGCVPVIGVSTVGVVRTTVEVDDDPRSIGSIVDDNVIEKKFLFKMAQVDEKYLIKISANSLDGRFILKGNVDTVEEKIKMTKLAWETDGVRSVENIIKVDDQSSWKDKATDLLISSQFKVAIIPYTFEHTSFNKLKKNDYVNLEFDILGKYLSKMISNYK